MTQFNEQYNNAETVSDEDIIFETFTLTNGKSFCCMQANGQRYYLDSGGTGQWQIFPTEWLTQGKIVQDNTQDELAENNLLRPSSPNPGNDSKIEFIDIEGRGKLQTQIFETRTRIHCYFDPDEATWLRLPINWELLSPSARQLIDLVKDVCPAWKCDGDILAALRVSNYNVDDCVNTFHSTFGKNNDAVIDSAISSSIDHKEAAVYKEKCNELKKLTAEFNKMKANINELETDLKKEKTAHERLKTQVEETRKLKESKKTKESTTGVTTPKDIAKTLEGMRAIIAALKKTVVAECQEMQNLNTKLAPKLQQFVNICNEHENQLSDTKALYRQEAQARRLLYNQLIELRGNIRVFCRIRPSTIKSKWLQLVEDNELVANMPNSSKRKYQFDNVFLPSASQELIFKDFVDIISSVADGYNVCIMAYGQTGSGKTYTMQGPPNNPGINIRSIKELLRVVETRKRTTFEMTMSMVEIYNETVMDLISKTNQCETVDLRHTGHGFQLIGANWPKVVTEEDMNQLMQQGEKNRHTAFTKMNASSSRSHLIVTVSVIGTDKISGAVSRGMLTLCDLAGSERIEKSGATTGERFAEATSINLSLSSLATVFVALRGSALHIPYRNSKLTQLLQPCLGGDAKTCLVVNVSDEPESLSETLSTLQFGSNARQVALGPARAHVQSISSGNAKLSN